MATYRLLEPAEIPAAVELWVKVFGVEAQFFETLLAGGHDDDFSVGAFEGDQQVSSVHVFIRWFRDRQGNPLKVGGIGSVSTLPEARSVGHSSHLLQMAIAEMENRDCVWSYLGTGVNDHYARHGWRSFSTASRRGILAPINSAGDLKPTPVTDDLLRQLSKIHFVTTAMRPMANDRSDAHWQHAVRYRVTGKTDGVYLSGPVENPSAYLVCRESPEQIELVEASFLPGNEEALATLIKDKLAHSAKAGITKVNSLFPVDSPESKVVEASCERWFASEDRGWMARPIGPELAWSDLGALLLDPTGRRSELDNF